MSEDIFDVNLGNAVALAWILFTSLICIHSEKQWNKVDERIKRKSQKGGLWAFKFPVLGF